MNYVGGKKKSEIMQFLFSLILLTVTESGKSRIDKCHEQTLSDLNDSVVLHDLGKLCVKRLRLFKKHWRELAGNSRKFPTY